MEKKSFENAINNSYDILANSETISNQFYLIQGDEDILNKNKEVQNVTQMHEVKGVVEDSNEANSCPVFDASSQQFYVYNVEPELLSLNDQFAIPSVENNAYTVAYLIQEDESGASTTSTEIAPKCLEPIEIETQATNVEILHGSKQENDLTEITLSDDQYHILEQKGWILLESSDKIFVLNTYGLHDITKDEKLIHILKNDLQDPELERKLRTESLYSREIEENGPKNEDNKVEFVLIDDAQNKEQIDKNIQFALKDNVDVEMDEQEQSIDVKPNIIEIPIQSNSEIIESNANIEKTKCNSIKIKTKYNFKDIPEKIFLGKTVNGKKLFAKVTKKNNKVNQNSSSIDQNIINESKEKKKFTMSVLRKKKVEKKPKVIPALDTARFVNLIQECFRTAQCQVAPETIEQMSSQVSQLMCLPNMKQSLVGTNVVITKMVSFNDTDIGHPQTLTGTVHLQDGKCRFIHVPQMLQNLLEESDGDQKQQSYPTETKLTEDVVDLFHIHLAESQYPDKPPQLSIHLNKRKLPLDVLKDAKKRHPNPIYACGSCGLIFKSELLLNNHQNNQCLEVEDELTIDTDEVSDGKETFYSLVTTGKEKWYTCNICQAKFSRLFNCQKHITTHKTSILEKKTNVHKCKMCPSVYHHSSSLSKHIMKMHLQIQK